MSEGSRTQGAVMTARDDGDRPTDLPRIWYSRIFETTEIDMGIDFEIEGGGLQYTRDYRARRPVARKDAPICLFFKRGYDKIVPAYRDAFKITDAIVVVSPKLRDVLSQFDLGGSGLFEVPIYQSDKTTLSAYPPHYILHVSEAKDCFFPEASEGVKRFLLWGETEPRPGAPWMPIAGRDRLTVRASAAAGADLWVDPKLLDRLFFSDRLKRAIDAAQVTSEVLTLSEATVLP